VREVEAREAATGAPYFVLSHAPAPWDCQGHSKQQDVWVVQLFNDLCERVSVVAQLPGGRAKCGFMEEERREYDNRWPPGLARAIATCRVFVPLLSRSYFDSEECGKEWFAFTGRGLNSASHDQSATRAIVPALWNPVDARYLPGVARSIHFNHAELGARYAENGFYGIIKRSKYQGDYVNAVDGLARLILKAAREAPAPVPAVDYASLVSAFEPEARSMPGGHPLRITIVAPCQGELPRGCSASRYGPDACGWNPYQPETARRLADHAAELARALGYRPDVGDLNQHGRELLRGGRPASPQVLIVDAWATRIDRYARLLRCLDVMDKPWVQVVVPWQDGREDAAVTAELQAALAAALGRKLAGGRATSLPAIRSVLSLDDFSRVLPTVIMTAARQYLRHAPSFPPAAAEVERPRLSLFLPDPSNTELPGA
jgi:FxsC-like protein